MLGAPLRGTPLLTHCSLQSLACLPACLPFWLVLSGVTMCLQHPPTTTSFLHCACDTDPPREPHSPQLLVLKASHGHRKKVS